MKDVIDKKVIVYEVKLFDEKEVYNKVCVVREVKKLDRKTSWNNSDWKRTQDAWFDDEVKVFVEVKE